MFSPDDPSAVNAPSGATAEVSEDESGQYMRIRSGTTGAAVVFDVGQGVLEQIAGKKATFDIVSARRGGPADRRWRSTAISARLGDCGRKRYAVGYEKRRISCSMSTCRRRAPGAGGTIAIISDFSNEGKAVDIYEIKVSVAR